MAQLSLSAGDLLGPYFGSKRFYLGWFVPSPFSVQMFCEVSVCVCLIALLHLNKEFTQ